MLKLFYFFALLQLCLFSCTSKERDIRVYSVTKTQAQPSALAMALQDSGSFQWKSPASWKELPGDSIRQVIFQVPAKTGEAEASIVVFGGAAGGMEANVNRWREQAGLKPMGASDVLRSAEIGKTILGEYQLFQIIGAEGKSSIMAAIFPLPSRTLFVKLIGKQEVIKSQKANFLALCQSIRASGEN